MICETASVNVNSLMMKSLRHGASVFRLFSEYE